MTDLIIDGRVASSAKSNTLRIWRSNCLEVLDRFSRGLDRPKSVLRFDIHKSRRIPSSGGGMVVAELLVAWLNVALSCVRTVIDLQTARCRGVRETGRPTHPFTKCQEWLWNAKDNGMQNETNFRLPTVGKTCLLLKQTERDLTTIG